MTAVQDCQTRIEQCQGLVRSLAARIHRKLPAYIEMDDLIAYGQVGLAEAARDFDPERGHQFSTFAYYRIRGAIYDGLAKMSWFSRREYHQLRYRQMAGDVLSHDADAPETAQSADLDGEMRWFRDLGQTLAVVHLATGMERGERGQGAAQSPIDTATPAPPTAAMRREIDQRLHELVDALPSDAGRLIRAVYFEELDLQKAGQRIGVSKSWASRLHAKTLQRLARGLRHSDTVLER